MSLTDATFRASEPVATLVVCEDDASTLELLCDHLEADRFRALPAPSAADALRLCHFKQPDLMLLDLRLPDGSGLDVLRQIRACDGTAGRYDPGLPVIVVSGRSGEADRLRGFGEGADDYLTKPVHVGELAMRIRAVLRRRGEGRSGPLRAGDLLVDPLRREVWVEGRLVKLAKKEFELLRTLAADPLRVFSKEELLRDVWGFRAAGNTRTLDSHASRVRRKLDPQGRRFVVNVWGYGYRLLNGTESSPEATEVPVNGAGW
jgi:DNA-binding response OmpR family regulator